MNETLNAPLMLP